MNLSELIGLDGIIIEERDMSVDSAIDLCCSTLVKKGKVSEKYAEAIKNSHKELGPYYVLAPKIAMPHARPEDGVIEKGLQLTVFRHGVDLESKENGNVFMAITLAAEDSSNHIETIMQLSELFQNEEDVESIISSNSANEIYEILEQY
ncbi:PTS sugar transporter subunit IIA [Vibrio hangzhouensis]|uniref:PTS system IIA component, L-Asc family n=1 Tax=Vibrio hangzhouensis TaxID=462991 RepID=A0A1H5RQE8_9VIBR|nr:PTS sugar transporter subunit IIA [Vibrio hangzhouensis]SEF40490.1 PTS system IIA component, L-Asc family [Vibrio hangzhouensis]